MTSQSFRFRRRIGFPPVAAEGPSNRSLAIRWGSQHLFEDGFVGVPAAFLKYYALLNISSGEAMFVLHLMSFKWNEKAPFPSYKTLAQRMGITSEMARRHAKSLEEKQFLRRMKRTGRSNEFDLMPLTAALEQVLEKKKEVVASLAA